MTFDETFARATGTRVGIYNLMIAVIIAVIIGVIVGNFALDAYELFVMISNGEVIGYTVTDIPGMIVILLMNNSEYFSAVMGNMGIGLLFAGLGVFSLLRKAGQEVAGQKFIVLE